MLKEAGVQHSIHRNLRLFFVTSASVISRRFPIANVNVALWVIRGLLSQGSPLWCFYALCPRTTSIYDSSSCEAILGRATSGSAVFVILFLCHGCKYLGWIQTSRVSVDSLWNVTSFNRVSQVILATLQDPVKSFNQLVWTKQFWWVQSSASTISHQLSTQGLVS